ncbi:hypothetical protein Bca52824_092698 [Brassica carinata]|uniref:Uncharacterized protein n=1 Tax=Brassica carinata TaxID=52824 RepID=A0A8X7P3V9_BRACI|nr:hypothetical protein Bca52824_092698 [Brassica carinata]
MKSLLGNLASNNIIRMLAGKRYYGEENDEAKFVRQLVAEVVISSGAGNPADYLSVVRWFTNYEKRIKDLGNRNEIDDKIGFDRLVDEPDIVKLPYLQNIVSETLRLYPAVPLLLPHLSSNDCKVAGYDVPRGTMVLTNVWAMQRDPTLWEAAEMFKPERFDKAGEADKLLPFGMGRRACPGAGLAQRLVSLVLGTLVQCFEWERVGDELVDMTEDKGATLPKLVPLRTMCKARPIVAKLI